MQKEATPNNGKETEREEKQAKCQHLWFDGGKNSSIKYSKCQKCHKTVYYSHD